MFSDSQRRRNGLAFVRTTFLSVFLTVALSTIASSQEIPRSGFRLVESHEPDLIETFVQANVDQKISIKEFLRDASRNAELSSGEDAKIRGYATGFRWIESDEGTEPTWSPAGITLASDAYNTLEEREALGLEDAMIVSWWDARNRTGDQPAGDSKMGVRITIVADATKNDRESEGGRLRVYKHALLVEPTTLELEDGTEVASFKAMPEIQKPAIVWRDHWLYMIDSTNGIRVFDLNMLFKVKIGSGFGYVDEGQYEAYSHTHVLMQDR